MDAHSHRPNGHPMPEVAVFIANLRAAFGDAVINDAIARGKAGEPVFHACENGHSVGTASPASENVWRVDSSIRDRRFCAGCDGKCMGQGVRCSDWLAKRHTEK